MPSRGGRAPASSECKARGQAGNDHEPSTTHEPTREHVGRRGTVAGPLPAEAPGDVESDGKGARQGSTLGGGVRSRGPRPAVTRPGTQRWWREARANDSQPTEEVLGGDWRWEKRKKNLALVQSWNGKPNPNSGL